MNDAVWRFLWWASCVVPGIVQRQIPTSTIIISFNNSKVGMFIAYTKNSNAYTYHHHPPHQTSRVVRASVASIINVCISSRRICRTERGTEALYNAQINLAAATSPINAIFNVLHGFWGSEVVFDQPTQFALALRVLQAAKRPTATGVTPLHFALCALLTLRAR